MSTPFMFKPEMPVAKVKGRELVYHCCICGKTDVPAKDCYFTGPFMSEYRDPLKFACKKHSEY